jgi:Pyruvate/2-oxoacid:ferredoxin oxidoreductase gamma subunit
MLLTGIGGQGIQLAARTLSVAAIAEDREVMTFGMYGGSMRGGNTDSTVIIGTERLTMPPTVSKAWGAFAMHHDYWPGVRDRLVPSGVAIIDRSVFRGPTECPTGAEVIEIEASKIATDSGAPQTASMVMLGAFASVTRLVNLESLLAASAEVLPSYRSHLADTNAAALEIGWSLLDAVLVDAWPPRTPAVPSGGARG